MRRFSVVLLGAIAIGASSLLCSHLAFASDATAPRVPFGNAPCKSLTQEEQQSIEQKGLGYSRPTAGKADRAPATLSFDNVCSYSGYVNVGYMTKIDYQTNSSSNRNTSESAPGDLPQAFYDKQG